MVNTARADRQAAFINPSQTPGPVTAHPQDRGLQLGGLRLQALFQVDGARLRAAAPSGPGQQRSLFGALAGAGSRVDLGGLTGAHSVPSEVCYGCFMEIILWSL